MLRLGAARTAQASALESLRHTQALVEKQRALLAGQTSALEGLRRDVDILESRLQDRTAAKLETAELIGNANQIEADYAAWRQSLAELERWETIARTFRDHEHKRAPMLQQIAAERARLEQELAQLEARKTLVEQARTAVSTLEQELKESEAALALADSAMQARTALQGELAAQREDLAGKSAENKNLKDKMDDLKRRIETLDASTDASCPLCGQELTLDHRLSTLKRLQAEGRELGDRYRANTTMIQSLRGSAEEMQARLSRQAGTDDDRMRRSREVAAITERLKAQRREIDQWAATGDKRMLDLANALATDDFAAPARRKLAAVDAELAALGYDAAAHDGVRRQEASLRTAEQAHGRLQSVRGALDPLENEIRSLQAQIIRTQARPREPVHPGGGSTGRSGGAGCTSAGLGESREPAL